MPEFPQPWRLPRRSGIDFALTNYANTPGIDDDTWCRLVRELLPRNLDLLLEEEP